MNRTWISIFLTCMVWTIRVHSDDSDLPQGWKWGSPPGSPYEFPIPEKCIPSASGKVWSSLADGSGWCVSGIVPRPNSCHGEMLYVTSRCMKPGMSGPFKYPCGRAVVTGVGLNPRDGSILGPQVCDIFTGEMGISKDHPHHHLHGRLNPLFKSNEALRGRIASPRILKQSSSKGINERLQYRSKFNFPSSRSVGLPVGSIAGAVGEVLGGATEFGDGCVPYYNGFCREQISEDIAWRKQRIGELAKGIDNLEGYFGQLPYTGRVVIMMITGAGCRIRESYREIAEQRSRIEHLDAYLSDMGL